MSKLPDNAQQRIDDFFKTTAMSFGEMSAEMRRKAAELATDQEFGDE